MSTFDEMERVLRSRPSYREWRRDPVGKRRAITIEAFTSDAGFSIALSEQYQDRELDEAILNAEAPTLEAAILKAIAAFDALATNQKEPNGSP